MPYITTEHGKIHYEVKGGGSAIVMLHGLSRSSEYWHGFDKELSKNNTVSTIDARGLGKSDHTINWTTSIKDHACDIMLVLDHLKISKAHLFGLSLGGMVAIAAATLYPERIKSLFIINSSVGGFLSMRISPSAIKAIIHGISRPSTLSERIMKVAVSESISIPKRQQIKKEWQKIIKRDGIPYTSTAKQLIAAIRFNKDIGVESITAPTAIVCGTKDRFVPTTNSIALSKILPNAKLILISGAGHEAPLDSPKMIKEALWDHIKQTDQMDGICL